MAYKLIVTAHAEADIDEHIGYIVEELHNPKAASDLLDAVEKHYDQLEENPYVYAVCQQTLLKVREYRKVIINGYIMIFRIDDERKTVIIERFFSRLEDYASKL